MRRLLALAVTGILCAGCAPAGSADLETLAQWMTGSFRSAEQAAADPDYYDIRLEMVPIWTDRQDATWLYVEQAAAGQFGPPGRRPFA